jgi:hypothetical protein
VILKRIKIENNGEVETTWALSQEQYHVLLNYAIDSLLSRGLISTIDISEEDLAKMQQEAEGVAATELLNTLDETKLHQA